MVYILNEKNEPLMPTTRYRHIKKLIRDGKAVKVSSYPYVVKLLYDTPGVTQPLVCGIDPGRTNVGIAVVKEDGSPVFEAELVTRNKEIPKRMKERKGFRQKHRSCRRRKKRIRRAVAAGTTTPKECREQKAVNATKTVGVIERRLPGCKEAVKCIGIRNKKARFNNRKRPDGWLTPTANQLLQTHINLVKRVQKFLPISSIVLEVNRFAFLAMDIPNIQKWQYQRGPLYGKGSVDEAVYALQDGRCIFCGDAIEHYHHIIPVSKGGSDTLPNKVGLCRMHHDLVHKDEKVKAALAEKKDGLNQKYGALSVLNQIIPRLAESCASMLPTAVTDGRSTKAFREANGVEKSHSSDAYCIACSTLPGCSVKAFEEAPFLLRQFRRHDRQACKQENVVRRYTLNGKVVAKNRHKAMEQFDDSLEEYVASGGRTDNLTVKDHRRTMKQMDRILPGAVLLADGAAKVMTASRGRHNGKPDYYEFADGTRVTPRHCKLARQNTGIVFVSKTVSL